MTRTETVTNEGVAIFLIGLNKYMRSLVRLELHLENSENNVLEAIGNNLKRNLAASLIELHLSFTHMEITLEPLCLKIKKQLRFLKVLSFERHGDRKGYYYDTQKLEALFANLSYFQIRGSGYFSSEIKQTLMKLMT